MKRVSFNAIACELKFGSHQVDEVYHEFSLFDRGDQMFPAIILKSYKGRLPKEFKKWLDCCEESMNIVFEQRTTPKDFNFNDWNLMSL